MDKGGTGGERWAGVEYEGVGWVFGMGLEVKAWLLNVNFGLDGWTKLGLLGAVIWVMLSLL